MVVEVVCLFVVLLLGRWGNVMVNEAPMGMAT